MSEVASRPGKCELIACSAENSEWVGLAGGQPVQAQGDGFCCVKSKQLRLARSPESAKNSYIGGE